MGKRKSASAGEMPTTLPDGKDVTMMAPEWLNLPEAGLPVQEQIQYLISQVMPGTVGMEITELTEDTMSGKLPFQPSTANAGGIMHGGTIFTLGDTLTGCLLWARKPTARFVTASSSVRYLRPVTGGWLHCKATLLSTEGNRYRMQADCFNDSGKRVARMKIDYVELKV